MTWWPAGSWRPSFRPIGTGRLRSPPWPGRNRSSPRAGRTWRILYGRDEEEEAEPALPALAEGQTVNLDGVEVQEKTTKPPKRFSEASLLGTMENAGRQIKDETLAEMLKAKGGIGTPATRAAIIERLIQVGYIVRQKKDLVPSQKGEAIIDLVDERLKSAELTAQWEHRLLEIEQGARPTGFWSGIVSMTREIVEALKQQPQRTVPGQQARPAKTRQPGRTRKSRGARRAG